MGISLNKLNEKGMRCPMMGGIECMGDSCMLWSWDFDGRESTEYTTVHVALGGEWVKDGDPYDVEEGGLERTGWGLGYLLMELAPGCDVEGTDIFLEVV